MNKIKYPYNVNQLTQSKAIEALKDPDKKDAFVKEIFKQRKSLAKTLNQLDIVKKVYPSEANFLLVRFIDAALVYKHLMKNNIIVRDRSNQLHCDNCLRITVGTNEENEKLLNDLKELDDKHETSSVY
jgi:histidinol-phosphate aminotransferase